MYTPGATPNLDPGIMTALSGGAPTPQLPQMGGGGITLGGVPAFPGGQARPGGMPAMGTPRTAPGYPSGPMAQGPGPNAGNGSVGGNMFGSPGFANMMSNPNVPQYLRDYMTALQGWLGTRPEAGGGGEGVRTWLDGRPRFGDFRNPGAPAPAAVPPAAAGIAPGAPNGVGQSMNVRGMIPGAEGQLPGY